jgi:uncharacterized protein (TIRG00374 family)
MALEKTIRVAEIKTRKYKSFPEYRPMYYLSTKIICMRKGVFRKIIYYALHVVGFILLYLVLRNFNWKGFLELFSAFKVIDFAAGFGLLILVYVFKSWRWMVINRTFGIKIPYGTTMIYFMVAGFLSVITPGRIGEFAKIFFIRRKANVPGVVATTTVILDRVWDVLILTLLGGAGIIMVFGRFQLDPLTITVIAAFFLLSLVIILFPPVIFIPVKFLFRKREKLSGELDQVFDSWKKNALKLFLPGFFSTLAAFLALALIPLIFTARLEQEVGMIPSISAVSISNMLAFLPVTVAGFGTRELVFSEVWKLLEYTTESAITISTAYFICNYLGSVLLGGVSYLAWFRKHFSIREIRAAD